MSLALVLAVAALTLLLTLALIWSNWPAWLKGCLLGGVGVFYFWAYGVVSSVWGWPSEQALPERFVLLAAVIEEPTTKTAGALYVWVNPITEGKPAREPRAHRLPYSKDLHALLNEGMKKARQGVSQMGTAETKRGRQGYMAWLKPGAEEQEVKIRDLPLPQLPEK